MLPRDIRELIIDMKYSMEMHEIHTRLMIELDTTLFYRQITDWYDKFARLFTMTHYVFD